MPPRRKPASPSSAAVPPPPPAAVHGTDGPPQPGQNRYLPPLEAEKFRQVLSLYENKENAKGLELVKEILVKFPDHGESLTMRGIFVHSLGSPSQKAEGYSYTQRGVKNDPGSHIVWHVYALMRRSDKQFEEALECYKKAVEIEKDSLNLLNDLSTLTIHLRHYTSYVTVRLSILRVQPRLRRNWLTLAIAQFLASDHAGASRTLTYYENMLREVPKGDIEMGEVLLFHAKVLEEAGEYEKCLEFLGEKSEQIPDRDAYGVQRARLLLLLSRGDPALWAWETLLSENPESRFNIRSTILAKGGNPDAAYDDEEGRKKAVEIVEELGEKYPGSAAIRRLGLDLAVGDDFRTKLTSYLLIRLSKGIPSLFADIKALYKLPNGEGADKAKVVGEVVEKFRKELEEKGAVVTDEEGDDPTVDSPSTYLWTLYFLSSHHSHPSNRSSSQSLALSTLSLASTHTPTLPELLTLRARILKRSGDAVGAAREMERARELDLQDRFLNAKAAKYWIRAGEGERAEKTAGLFTKKDAPSPLEDLVEMQCLWFLQEEGDAYVRSEDWGKALKRYTQILDIFQEIEEDQYDFHSYCMRKSTLNAYIDLLRFEDTLRTHPRFAAAAKGAIEIYLAIKDEPSRFSPVKEKGEEKKEEEANGEVEGEEKDEKEGNEEVNGGEAEKKKKKKGKGKKNADKKDAPPPPPSFGNVYTDPDPLGSTLLTSALSSPSAPLLAAQKFLTHLIRARPNSVETWVLAAEVNLRYPAKEGKLLQALKALQTAKALSPNSAKVVPSVVRYKLAVDAASTDGGVNPSVLKVLQAGVVELLGSEEITAAQWIDEQLQRSSGAQGEREEWILQAAEAKRVAGVSEEEVVALVGQLVERKDLEANLEHLLRALSLLRRLPSTSISPSSLSSFLTAASSRFPLARAFKTPEELAAEDAKNGVNGEEQGEKEKEVIEA